MLSSFLSPRCKLAWLVGFFSVAIAVAGLASSAFAQATISTGSIQGIVTDPSGAVLPSAKVTVTNTGTGQSLSLTTGSSGLYSTGSIAPGEYQLRVESKGFRTAELPVTVQVGNTSTGNIKLEVGESSQVVEVQGAAVQINTEQATVQGVVTPEQIENLPINGRNFLDLAQLEPGIQVQDGAGFDPTKNGFESISVGGRAGRTARIMVDGVDISDENVGTTTEDIPASAIQEFSIAQSSLDLSSSLTSSGTVSVTTKSGTNALHGEGFYGFRDGRVGFAAFPGGVTPPFQRNQMGGNIGGAIIKDKLFFFADTERTKQDFGNAVTFSAPFSDLSGVYSAPYRDNEDVGRLDWTVRSNLHMFYKFGYNNNSDLKPANNYSPFLNRDNTPSHTVGLDFSSGSFTSSLRYGYNYFNNSLGVAGSGGGLIDPDPNLFMVANSGGMITGPNVNAPQGTIQANHQLRYDGSKLWRNHIFRFGTAYDRISVGSFAAFGALGAQVVYSPSAAAASFAPALGPGGSPADNPLNYPVSSVTLFNGQGAFSEKTAFDKKAYSGFFDNRIEFYGGDAWKVRPNLTVNYGVHYVLDTNRNNNDLNNNPTLAAALNQFGPGLGNKTNAPKLDFSPELGVAWDPWRNGKTVFRAGAGLYYENTPINDILFDRVSRLPTGLFFGDTGFCGSTTSVVFPGVATPVSSSDGIPLTGAPGTAICGSPASQTIGGVTVAKAIADLQTAYQAATVTAGPGRNGSYVPNLGGTIGNPASTLAPNYVTPRSFQWNIGFQHQIARGTVLSVDYVHNTGTHFLLGVDANHVGAARNLNAANAAAAIQTTLSNCGAATITQSYSANCSRDPSTGTTDKGTYGTAANPARPATIVDYATNGLDASGTLPNPAAAFPGTNPAVGFGEVFYPIGDSRYDALQMSVRSNVEHPFRGIAQMNLVLSYAFSRLDSNYPYTVNTGSQVSGDQDFLNPAVDWDHPNRYFGPAAQDRTHQLSFGPVLQIAHRGPLVSFIGHIDSPLPLTLVLPQLGGGGQAGEIFRTDVTGDGTVGYPAGQGGDIVPGSNVGSFGRSISPSGLNGFINKYNATSANQLTPAGQALVSANLFTQTQLTALGAVTPTIADAPPGNVGMGWLRSVDFRFAWPVKLRERLTIEPSITAFNVFNFGNFDSSVNSLSGILQATPGTSVNNVTGFSSNCPSGTCRAGDRLGPGSGVFSLGAARQIEFGLKVQF